MKGRIVKTEPYTCTYSMYYGFENKGVKATPASVTIYSMYGGTSEYIH